jgi:hypothetical protein
MVVSMVVIMVVRCPHLVMVVKRPRLIMVVKRPRFAKPTGG